MEIKDVNGTSVVCLSGEINAQTGSEIKAKIVELFESKNKVVLSFKGVVYMNSSGLREIIDLFKNATKNKKEMSLCEMSQDIREMFAFTGLDRVFKIADTEAEALS